VSHSFHLVGAISWIEISSCGDAGFSSVGWVAVTLTELVVSVVVVPVCQGNSIFSRVSTITRPHQVFQRFEILHLVLVAVKDASSRRESPLPPVVGITLEVEPTHLGDLLEIRT